jgi:pimeloyl-ACP methyl ester carboxylesterase
MKQAIVIIGGYNALWTAYLGMARHLEDVSGLPAVGVPLAPWHWLQLRRTEDATPMLQKVHETVQWARRRLQAERFVLVGHSAGGLLGRLYLHEDPVWGWRYAGAQHVDMLITLGSPHCANRGTDTGWYLSDEANRLVPGAPYADTVRYLAVVGRAVPGHPHGNYAQRRAFRGYQYFSPWVDAWGDGIVPLSSASLDGAEALVLDGVSHSRRYGRDWYGASRAIVCRWWPRSWRTGEDDA